MKSISEACLRSDPAVVLAYLVDFGGTRNPEGITCAEAVIPLPDRVWSGFRVSLDTLVALVSRSISIAKRWTSTS